jgi:hypothetical protein
MRNIIIIVFVLFSTLTIKAQPYQSVFGPDTTKWDSFWCNISLPDIYTVFVTNNDTTFIDGKTYRISYSFNGCNPNFIEKCGFLREDTLTGKLWHLPNRENSKEFLAMDLELQKADTFSMKDSPFYINPRYLIVDSVYYSNEKKVVRFKKAIGCLKNSELFFIEGIGPGYGLNPLGYSDVDALLLKHHNDSLVYTSPSYELFKNYLNCNVNITPKQHKPQFAIHAVNSTSIELFIAEENKQTSLAVFDLSGKLVHHQSLHEGSNWIQLNQKGQLIFHIRSSYHSESFKINLK